MNNLAKRIENLESYYNELAKQHNEMSKLLGDISREIKTLKSEITNVAPSTGAAFVRQNSQVGARTANVSAGYSSTHTSVNTKSANIGANSFASKAGVSNFDINAIIAEYNRIFSYNGYEAKIASENFTKKYSIIGIACSNYEERVNSPSTPAVFETAQSLAKAHIWLIDIKNGYLGFLNPSRGYDEQKHDFADIKSFFSSNYDGRVYKSFRLVRPAVFQNVGGVWKAVQKGELRF